MTTLQRQIGKHDPFESPQQEAYLNLIRTAAALEADFNRLFRDHALSETSYNVLRILRAAGAKGRTCTEIGRHLVVQRPDITRLVDRLIDEGFSERARSTEDRRVVLVRITRRGRSLVDSLDEPVRDLHARQLGHMSPKQLNQLSRLLELARSQAQGDSR
jgi:DNA-binding MarR family transcriptional regulator